MRDAPIIRTAPVPGRSYGRKVNGVMKVRAGLNYLRGNTAPYFSLTAEVHRKGFPEQEWAGGAMHDEILRKFPSLQPLADLHLCDIDGAPMHAEANGLYWLAGWLGGLGQRYHGANGTPARTPDECREIARKHFRCTSQELDSLAFELRETEERAPFFDAPETVRKNSIRHFVEKMRPRWKREAEAAIQRFGLVVFGDAWPD